MRRAGASQSFLSSFARHTRKLPPAATATIAEENMAQSGQGFPMAAASRCAAPFPSAPAALTPVQRPKNFRIPPEHREIVRALLNDPDVQRIAGHGDCAPFFLLRPLFHPLSSPAGFAWYAPKAYAHVRAAMEALHASQPELCFNFINSIYAAATFNTGPNTVTFNHKDAANYPGSWCSVTSLGDYDPTKGGHLYLCELELCVEFPPNCTVLLPSAGVRHGNTPIQPREKRFSITQYIAGGLMRWVAHGFRPASGLSDAQRMARECAAGEGPDAMLDRFSEFWDLDEDRASLRAMEIEARRTRDAPAVAREQGGGLPQAKRPRCE
jgi:hypothetical protein